MRDLWRAAQGRDPEATEGQAVLAVMLVCLVVALVINFFGPG